MTTFMSKWENLPFSILIHIFSYVPMRFRPNVVLVCKTWKTAVTSPIVWKSLDLVLTGSNELDSSEVDCDISIAFRMTKHYGQWIKCLKILVVSMSPEEEKKNASTLTKLFRRLMELDESPQLKTLCLSGQWTRDPFDSKFDESALTIAQFLRMQSNLYYVSIKCQLKPLHGFLLLDALATHSSITVRGLNLKECFDISSIRNPERFLRYFMSYSNLNVLHLNYFQVNSECLLIIVKTCQQTLDYISIDCTSDLIHYIEPEELHKIPCLVWREIHELLPRLKVQFYLHVKTQNQKFINDIVPDEVPLTNLHYCEINKAISLIDYFQIFSRTLEVVSFTSDTDVIGPLLISESLMNSSSEILADSIVRLVLFCQKLKYLFLYGKLPLNIVDRLIVLRITEKSELQDLKIIFCNPTSVEQKQLSVLKDEYSAFDKLVLNIRIEWDSYDQLEDSTSDDTVSLDTDDEYEILQKNGELTSESDDFFGSDYSEKELSSSSEESLESVSELDESYENDYSEEEFEFTESD